MTTTHRTTTTALLVLSLAVAGGPAASAMPAGGTTAGAAKPAPAAVYSYQDKSMIPATAPSTGAGKAAKDRSPSTPTTPGPRSEVVSGSGYGSTVTRPAATSTSSGPGSDVSSTNGYDFARVPPTVVRTITEDSGFDWGDAAIGAGATLGLMLAATGGTLLLAHRRTQSRTAS